MTPGGSKVVQWIKVLAIQAWQPEFNLWSPLKGRREEPTPPSCLLTSKHGLPYNAHFFNSRSRGRRITVSMGPAQVTQHDAVSKKKKKQNQNQTNAEKLGVVAYAIHAMPAVSARQTRQFPVGKERKKKGDFPLYLSNVQVLLQSSVMLLVRKK